MACCYYLALLSVWELLPPLRMELIDLVLDLVPKI